MQTTNRQPAHQHDACRQPLMPRGEPNRSSVRPNHHVSADPSKIKSAGNGRWLAVAAQAQEAKPHHGLHGTNSVRLIWCRNPPSQSQESVYAATVRRPGIQ